MKLVRILLWLLVAAALTGLALLALRPTAPPASTVAIGAPFTLTGADGRPFATASLAGTPYALFFGFTHCPDTCPTTLARLVRLRRALGPDRAFAIVFVTVDPERDTPVVVGRYAGLFGSPVIGLTGSTAAIGQVAKSFGVYAQKVPQPGGDYSVDHTATVFLMDRTGRFQSTLSTDESDAVARQKLERLVKS